MILKAISAGSIKLDGGAMFGVVPKKIWAKLMPPDDQNLCTWSLRCLYLEIGEKKILIDTGIGDKQDPKFFAHYEPEGDLRITDALNKQGISANTITDVILTHLHFDHVGGALQRNDDQEIVPVFKNAVYWVHPDQWATANNPNQREKASFLSENIKPLTSLIKFLDDPSIFEKIEFVRVDGHTTGMVLPLLHVSETKKLLYAADLFPSIHHIHLPFIMAYDMQPLITLKEKASILDRITNERIAVFFEHDLNHEVAIIEKNESGRYLVSNTMTLIDWLLETEKMV